jgi:hypothetical protein
MRTIESWFSFENRCLLCGDKTSSVEIGLGGRNSQHLKTHVLEGYLSDDLEQIKPHPIGFPGPSLGQQPCSNPTSQG